MSLGAMVTREAAIARKLQRLRVARRLHDHGKHWRAADWETAFLRRSRCIDRMPVEWPTVEPVGNLNDLLMWTGRIGHALLLLALVALAACGDTTPAADAGVDVPAGVWCCPHGFDGGTTDGGT